MPVIESPAFLQRGRDSNPRYSFPYTHFPGVLLQPLGHLSLLFVGCKCKAYSAFNKIILREELPLTKKMIIFLPRQKAEAHFESSGGLLPL
jgi:hypothetical protein